MPTWYSTGLDGSPHEKITAAKWDRIKSNFDALWEKSTDPWAASTWNCSIYTTGSTGPGGQLVYGEYFRVGPMVHGYGSVQFTSNSTNMGSVGFYRIRPPKPIHSALTVGYTIGSGYLLDVSANRNYLLAAVRNTSTNLSLMLDNTTAAGFVTKTRPVTLSTADRMRFTITYPCTTT
jgi:hypothetical protein